MEKVFGSSSGRMLMAGVAAAGVGVLGASQWSAESPPPKPSGKTAAQIFAEIDTDKSGLVSATELKKALHKHGHPGSKAQVSEMMKLADRNDDGESLSRGVQGGHGEDGVALGQRVGCAQPAGKKAGLSTPSTVLEIRVTPGRSHGFMLIHVSMRRQDERLKLADGCVPWRAYARAQGPRADPEERRSAPRAPCR